MKNSSSASFADDVIARSHVVPVLVDFRAPWCGPCRMLAPTLKKLATEAAGTWELVKVDVDEHPELAVRFGIRGIPDVKLFVRGAVVAGFSGARPESFVRRWLDQELNSAASRA